MATLNWGGKTIDVGELDFSIESKDSEGFGKLEWYREDFYENEILKRTRWILGRGSFLYPVVVFRMKDSIINI